MRHRRWRDVATADLLACVIGRVLWCEVAQNKGEAEKKKKVQSGCH